MLSARLLRELYAAGFAIRKGQDRFVAVLRRVLTASHGKEWHKGDLPAVFRQLIKETVGPLCNDPEGPQLSRATFVRYMNAARKSLLFGIPFRLAIHLSIANVAEVQRMVAADTRSVPTEEKITDAIAQLRKERQQPIVQHQVKVDFDQLDVVVARYRKELNKARKLGQSPAPAVAAEVIGCLSW